MSKIKSKYVDIPSIVQVIGSIYNEPSLLDMDEKYHFYEEDFTEEFHKIIFGSIYNLHMLGAQEISINTIEDYLNNRPDKLAIYKLNKGAEYLQKISQNTQIATFDYYYNRMKKMTLLRAYEAIGVNLSWLYDVDNIFDAKKKQSQEDWLDNTSIEEIAETINRRIDDIKLKYADNAKGGIVQAGDGALTLLEQFKETPEIGYPLYGSLINTICRGARLRKFYLRSASTGLGKAIPNYTIIPTPDGYRKVGDIRPGDYLFGQDGKPTKVLRVYPQPRPQEIWRMTFSDGRVAECSKDHLWEYNFVKQSRVVTKVDSIEQIYTNSMKLTNGLRRSDEGYRYHVRKNEAVEYPEQEYFIEPYVMGLMLGNKKFKYDSIERILTLAFENIDMAEYIAENFGNIKYDRINRLTYHFYIPNDSSIKILLDNYSNLWNKENENISIPATYLLGSIDQRYDLLAGILDAGGKSLRRGIRIRYKTYSTTLRDNIITLCWSLGLVPTYKIEEVYNEELLEYKECYIMLIQAKKEDKPRLFKLSERRKEIEDYSKTKSKRKEYFAPIAITKIERTHTFADMTCFTVDNKDGLFLMNDFIVTHNTRSMIADTCFIGCDQLYNPSNQQWEENGTREPVMFITTEQSIDEIQTMMMAFVADVNEEHIINAQYQNGEWERVVKAAGILGKCPIYIKELPDFSLQDIENTIKLGIRDDGVRYIFLDYIHSSMKILGEISSKTNVKGLREDNILFMISTRLKDICNQYDVFILSATQLNSGYQTAKVYDQNLLRGAKSLSDKIDLGAIMVAVSPEDIEILQDVIKRGNFPTPKIKMSIYKNRRGRYKDILLWCDTDLGTCKINPLFVTNYNYELIEIEDLKIKVKPKIIEESEE